jgi:hypothetical protein
MSHIRAFFFVALLINPAFAAGPPNVVLISIDTLRADHLPMYGYGVATTPFLSSMASRGIVFEKASVPIPSTTPSHGSMLTGQYPSGHGSLALAVPLNRSVETIAEALQNAGYHTAGAVAVSHIGRAGNFDQGFDRFSDTANVKTREGKLVNADIFRFVEEHRRATSKKPLFLFVHYFDCHAPYGWWHGEVPAPATLPLAERISRYDESIRHVDGLIAELHRYLDSAGLIENTIFIVTADHGEQIGERGLAAGHADIYVETVHVPLIVFGSGIPAARVSEPVSSLDIAPSIAAMAGARLRQKIAGHNILPRRGDTFGKFLFQMHGLPGSATRELIVIGNSEYTRSVGLLSGSHFFIKNFDYAYRSFRREAMKTSSDSDHSRYTELVPLGEADGERRYAIPSRSYEEFVVTVDVVPRKNGCAGELHISIPAGVQYFSTTLAPTPRTRLQFSGARMDTVRISVNAATCNASLYYRLDRPADAPRMTGPTTQTYLFGILYAERKQRTSDELYDLDKDPGMTRNLIADRSLDGVRKQLELRTRSLYGEIYGAPFDRRKTTSMLSPEEIEKLKSLGYLF